MRKIAPSYGAYVASIVAAASMMPDAATASWSLAGPALRKVGVTSVAVAPSSPAILYLSAPPSFYRSLDGGSTWAWRSNDPPTALHVGHQNPAIVYGIREGTVVRTVDAGATWTSLNQGSYAASLVLDPADDDSVYVVSTRFFESVGPIPPSDSSVLAQRSMDGGATWAQVELSSARFGFYAPTSLQVVADLTAQAASGPPTLYVTSVADAGTGEGGLLFKSVDGAKTWSTLLDSADRLPGGDIQALHAEGDLLHACTRQGFFRSQDGGSHWSEGASDFSCNWVSGSPTGASGDHLYAARIEDRSGLWSVGGVFESFDGGAHWAAVTPGQLPAGTRALAMAASDVAPTAPTLFAGTTSSGVLRSEAGGGPWLPVNAGLTSDPVRALAFDPATPTIYARTEDGVARSVSAGPWELLDVASAPVASLPLPAGTFALADMLIGTGPAGSIRRPPSLPYPAEELFIVPGAAAEFFASVPDLGYPCHYDGCRAPSSLLRVTGVGSGQAEYLLVSEHVSAIAAGSGAPGTLYAATDDQDANRCHGVFVSGDGGTTWNPYTSGLTSLCVSDLASSPGGTMLAGTRDGVFQTTGNGKSWLPSSEGLDLPGSRVVRALAIHPLDSRTVYAGTMAGVYRSSDGGHRWQAMNDGLEDLDVHALAIDRTQGVSLYATTGHAMYSAPTNVVPMSCATAGDCVTGDACSVGACVGGRCAMAALTGFDGVLCAFANGPSIPECAGDRVPISLAKTFRQARALVKRAVQASPRNAKKLLKKAVRKVDQGLKVIHSTAHRKKRPLSTPCADGLRGLFKGVKGRIQAFHT